MHQTCALPPGAVGLPETEASVQVKINRGAFPAWFMLALMKAVGANAIRLE
ncbi:MAG: DUF6471 domain-containing protein [Sphingosinicella sp.]|uniref:DUF6471 domain-containing protein n=1 Tax=Sphingosinicella sp. TaxID=1917971 RepID=UPI0040382E8E